MFNITSFRHFFQYLSQVIDDVFLLRDIQCHVKECHDRLLEVRDYDVC